MENPRPRPISTSVVAEEEEEFLEAHLPSVDDLLDTLSAAADRSVLAAEAATEAERLAAIAAEEAAEAYLAASAAVGTESFARLKDIAEAAEKNTETLTSAAAAAYKAYFLAYAQSMDASAAVERAELDAAGNDPPQEQNLKDLSPGRKRGPFVPKLKKHPPVSSMVSISERLSSVNVDYQGQKLRSRQRLIMKPRLETKLRGSGSDVKTKKGGKLDPLEHEDMPARKSDCGLIPDLW